jgi:hypothetical protein
MNSILDDDLIKKYPKIFRDRYASMQVTAMCWGFECGEGWYNIIDALCYQIQHHIDWKRSQRSRALRYNRALTRAIKGDKNGLIKYLTYGDQPNEKTYENVEFEIKRNQLREVPQAPHQVVATQIKEKFGTLCFYYNGGNDYISGLVTMAEEFSNRTCENCGNPGKRRGNGWLYTACDFHTKPEHLDTQEEVLARLSVQNLNSSI